MVRKTRKQYSSKKTKGIYSIPELRRSFVHIEEYVNDKIQSKHSKDKIIKDLQKEWSHVFLKSLDKKHAEAFISDRLAKRHNYCRRTVRRNKTSGGAGAPNDYVTRQGMYLAPGQIPDANGHLPLSDGTKSSFGSYVQYVDKGFWNPEPGQSYDPVPGQPQWPVPPKDMGDNTVHFALKGGNRKTRRGNNVRRNKTRRGGSALGVVLSQAFSHPISASSPPGILQDMQDMWYGNKVGPSPDQVQRRVNYHSE